MTFKIQKIENSGVVYAEPTKPDLTVRVKHAAQAKTLNGVSVTNQATEIIITESHLITVGEVSATDALSVRLRVSGSLQATSRKKALLLALVSTIQNWDDEDVFSGFNPTTVPASPT